MNRTTGKPVDDSALRGFVEQRTPLRTSSAAEGSLPSARLAEALDALGRVGPDDDGARAEAALDFRRALDGQERTRALDAWIASDAASWVKSRPAQTAVVLDMAIRARIAGLDELITLVLETGTDAELLRVAGQRARHVAFNDQGLRTRAWVAFQRLSIDILHDAAVLPSAAHLGRKDSLDLLVGLLGREAPLAESAATGLLDLASLCTRPPSMLSDQERERISGAALDRIEKGDSVPDVVWLLGSVGTKATLERIGEALARAFVSKKHLEDAAAISAAGNLISEPFTGDAIKSLEHAIRRAKGDEEARFLHLAVTSVRAGQR